MIIVAKTTIQKLKQFKVAVVVAVIVYYITTWQQLLYKYYLEGLGYNADLYVFNDQTAQGYRGININANINSQENVDLLREAHIRDSSLALQASGSISLSDAFRYVVF